MQISAGNLDTPPARYDASLLIWQLYIHIYIYTYIPNTYTYVFILFFLSFFLLLARASPTYYVSISHVTLTQISVPHAPPATLLSFFTWVRAGEPDISRAVYGASTQTWQSHSAANISQKSARHSDYNVNMTVNLTLEKSLPTLWCFTAHDSPTARADHFQQSPEQWFLLNINRVTSWLLRMSAVVPQ